MTQEIAQRWADLNKISFYDAAKEIKYLLDLKTAKTPSREGR